MCYAYSDRVCLVSVALRAVSERWPRAGERACLDYIPLSAFSHLLEAQIHEHLFWLPVEEPKCGRSLVHSLAHFWKFIFTALSNSFLIPYSLLILSLLFLPWLFLSPSAIFILPSHLCIRAILTVEFHIFIMCRGIIVQKEITKTWTTGVWSIFYSIKLIVDESKILQECCNI